MTISVLGATMPAHLLKDPRNDGLVLWAFGRQLCLLSGGPVADGFRFGATPQGSPGQTLHALWACGRLTWRRQQGGPIGAA